MKRYIVPSLMIVVVLLIGGAALFASTESNFVPATVAADVKQQCASESDFEACYEKLVPPMVKDHSLGQVFDVVRALRKIDPRYQFCHTLAHKMAEGLVAKDPESWFNLVPMNPTDGLCSNGFIHGIIIGRFRNVVLDDAGLEKAMPGFKAACEPRPNWKPTDLDLGMCYHGIGHLYDYVTNANLSKAVSLCKETAAKSPSGNFLQVCSEGVFMQIFQPLEPDDFELLTHLPYKVTTENYRTFCAQYKADALVEGACLHEAWMLFRPSILSGEKLESFCKGQPNADETLKCKTTTYTILGRMLAGRLPEATAACSHVQDQHDQAYCVSLIAQTIIEEDRNEGEAAVAYCAGTKHYPDCMQNLASKARFIFGSTDRYGTFCSMMQEKGFSCTR